MTILALIISFVSLIIAVIALKLQLKSNAQVLQIQKQIGRVEQQIKITEDFLSQRIDEAEYIIRMQVVAESWPSV
jgi:hypothetical protein